MRLKMAKRFTFSSVTEKRARAIEAAAHAHNISEAEAIRRCVDKVLFKKEHAIKSERKVFWLWRFFGS